MDRKSGGGSRRKKVTGNASGGGVFRRGSGVNTPGGRPLGNAGGYQDRREGSSGPIGGQRGTGGYPPFRSPGGRAPQGCSLSIGKLVPLIVILVIAYFLLRSCTGLFDGTEQTLLTTDTTGAVNTTASTTRTTLWTGNTGSSPSGSTTMPSSAALATRERWTEIRGNGRDVFTIMVYICGSDLETDAGMATSDINEMLYAKVNNPNLNIILETGGTKKWSNSVMKSTTNQRYLVTGTGLKLIQDNVGKKAMTDPDTLQDFVRYCAANYPANRNALILWDHGSGSLGGFGYDTLFPNSGSMTIDEINAALSGAGVKFDFIGFDACLMATLETAYMLNNHADYMIASEETEPGIGWYYTNWLSELSDNTSLDTRTIGKQIIDDYIAKCASSAPNQTTTLSMVDLVALNNQVDSAFRSFANSANGQLDADYKVVSNARGDAREFGQAKLDQVDLVDLAKNIDSMEATRLVNALDTCIVYNKTSRNITRAHGLSIYFPYDELRGLSSMLAIYDRIGMRQEYTALVKKFANLAAGGQITSSGSTNPLDALFGSSGGSSSGSSSDIWSAAWNAFFANADFSSITGLSSGDPGSWIDEDLIQSNAGFYERNYLDAGQLELTRKGASTVLQLTDEQWDLIQKVELNVFYDDGEGYIDLGLDNIYEFDQDGDLIIDYDGTWLALDNHVVAYYVDTIEDDGTAWSITGRIPAMLNGQLVDIIVQFNEDVPYGAVAGARINYAGLTPTIAKGLIDIKEGDVIDFLCDYYSYDEEYEKSYELGEQMIVSGNLSVSNVRIGQGPMKVTYRLTDIYNNTYWTPAVTYP